ncbi:hypothetical protein Tco_0672420 [Tanacetum coccineum]
MLVDACFHLVKDILDIGKFSNQCESASRALCDSGGCGSFFDNPILENKDVFCAITLVISVSVRFHIFRTVQSLQDCEDGLVKLMLKLKFGSESVDEIDNVEEVRMMLINICLKTLNLKLVLNAKHLFIYNSSPKDLLQHDVCTPS